MSNLNINSLTTLDGLTTKQVSELVEQSDLDSLKGVVAVQDSNELTSQDTPTVDRGYLVLEGTKRGLYQFDASDLSTEVSRDDYQIKYIAPDSDDTGSSGAYVKVAEGKVTSVEEYGIAGGESSGWTTLESDEEIAAKSSGTPIVITPEDVALPNRAVKTWKRPAGIKDGAVAASFTLHPDESERSTQVTGHSQLNQIGSYAGRDSVAVFFQNYSGPAVADTNNTVFTDTSVSSSDFNGVWDEIKVGMIVDEGYPSAEWRGGVITEKVEPNTLVVSGWYEIDGDPTPTVAATPDDGSNVKVNVYSGVWGMNGNVRIQDGDTASKGVGFELGMTCNKEGTGEGSTIFDALNLGGSEKPGIGYHARGGLLTAFKQSGAGTGTGFNAQNSDQGFLAEGSKVASFRSVNPEGRHFSTVVDGANKFTIEADGTCGNLFGATQIVSSSTTVSNNATIVLINASDLTLSLPTPGGRLGKMVFVRNASAGGATVDGESIGTGKGVLFVSDGDTWIEAIRGA